MSRFHDQVVWLTGASTGIGAAVARRLAAAGAKLALTARNEQQLKALAKELTIGSCQAGIFPGDVTDRNRMIELATEIQETLGPIDTLFACAGTFVPTQIESFNSAEYETQLRVNYLGVLHCIEAVLPSMLERRSGRLVGVASLTGYRGLPRAAAYGASKAALINFFESMRFDLKGKGVAVTIVNPGFVKTPLTDKNDFQMPCLIDASKAAEIIVKGLEKGKKEIHFPARFSWALKTLRILPYPLYEYIIQRRVLKQ